MSSTASERMTWTPDDDLVITPPEGEVAPPMPTAKDLPAKPLTGEDHADSVLKPS